MKKLKLILAISMVSIFTFAYIPNLQAENNLEVSNFIANPGNNLNFLNWNNPQSDEHAGTMIVQSLTAEISWGPQNETIYFADDELSNNLKVIYYSTGSEFEDLDLNNDQTYYYQAFTVNYDIEYSNGSQIISSKPNSDSTGPDSTELQGQGKNQSLKLNWLPLNTTDLKNYKVTCDFNNEQIIEETTQTTLEIHNIENNIVYTCSVKGIDFSNNEGLDSNFVELTTGENVDNASNYQISSLEAEVIDENIILNWDYITTSNFSHYNVYINYEEYNIPIEIKKESPTNTYIFTEAEADILYDFEITLVDRGNLESNKSNKVSASLNNDGDDDNESDGINNNVPSNLEGESIFTNANLTWEADNLTEILGFNIYKKCTNDEAFILANRQLMRETNDKVRNLPLGSTCQFYITSVDHEYDESLASNIISLEITNDTEFPDSILGLELFPGNKQITAEWTAVTNEDLKGYNVYLDGLLRIPPSPTPNTEVTLSNLNNCQEYSIKITAIDEANNEGQGQSKNFILPSEEACNNGLLPISDLENTNTEDSIIFNWNNGDGNNNYNIYLDGNLLEETSEGSITLTGLEKCKAYNIKINSTNEAANESLGFSKEFMIPNYTECKNNLSNTDNSGNKVANLDTGESKISWTYNLGDNNTVGYKVYRGQNLDSMSLLNSSYLITRSPFVDSDSISGNKYYYKVAAINANGDETETSDFITITSKDASNAGPFNDVFTLVHTFFNYVEKLRTFRIVQGYNGHIYKPNQSITRAEALKLIMKSAKIEAINDLHFHDYADLENNIWFYNYIQTASFEGIVKGYSDGYFRPNRNVSRIEFLKMVMNTGKVKINDNYTNPFLDMNNNFWGTSFAKTGYNVGIISGYANDVFIPNQDITRAEAAKIVSYLLN